VVKQDFPPLQAVGIAVLHSARINREDAKSAKGILLLSRKPIFAIPFAQLAPSR